jgi:hypothetical protein
MCACKVSGRNPHKMGAEKKIRVIYGAQLSCTSHRHHPNEPSISASPTGATLETISRKEHMAVLAGAIRITMILGSSTKVFPIFRAR